MNSTKTSVDDSCTVWSAFGVLIVSWLIGIIISSSSLMVYTMMNDVPDYDSGHVLRLPQSHDLVVFSTAQAFWFNPLLFVSAIMGCLLGTPLVNFVGLRFAMILTVPLFMASWYVLCFMSQVWVLYLSRVLTGFAVGVNYFIVPTYIFDISPNRLRGFLGTCHVTMVMSGILTAYVMMPYFTVDGGDIYMIDSNNAETRIGSAPPGSFYNWRYISLVNVIPTAMFTLALLLVPKSPGWLASKGLVYESMAVRESIRGGVDNISESDIEDILTANEPVVHAYNIASLWRIRKQLFHAITFQFIQQFSGIGMLLLLGYWINRSELIQWLNGVSVLLLLQLIAVSAVASVMIDAVAENPRLIVGAVCMSVSCGMMGIFFSFKNDELDSKLPFLIIGCGFVYVFGYSLGLGAVPPWVVIGVQLSKLPFTVRTRVHAVAGAMNLAFAFIVSVSFGYLVDLVKLHGIFGIYAVYCVVAAVFTLLYSSSPKSAAVHGNQKRIIEAKQHELLLDQETGDGDDYSSSTTSNSKRYINKVTAPLTTKDRRFFRRKYGNRKPMENTPAATRRVEEEATPPEPKIPFRETPAGKWQQDLLYKDRGTRYASGQQQLIFSKRELEPEWTSINEELNEYRRPCAMPTRPAYFPGYCIGVGRPKRGLLGQSRSATDEASLLGRTARIVNNHRGPPRKRQQQYRSRSPSDRSLDIIRGMALH